MNILLQVSHSHLFSKLYLSFFQKTIAGNSHISPSSTTRRCSSHFSHALSRSLSLSLSLSLCLTLSHELFYPLSLSIFLSLLFSLFAFFLLLFERKPNYRFCNRPSTSRPLCMLVPWPLLLSIKSGERKCGPERSSSIAVRSVYAIFYYVESVIMNFHSGTSSFSCKCFQAFVQLSNFTNYLVGRSSFPLAVLNSTTLTWLWDPGRVQITIPFFH